jgi:hypothetical protein
VDGLALRGRAPELRVAVLEAATCGWGPSGRDGSFIHGYWSYVPMLRELLGDERALGLCRAGDRIAPAVRAFLERRGEDAWLREAGMLEVATTAAQEGRGRRGDRRRPRCRPARGGGAGRAARHLASVRAVTQPAK